MRHMEYYGGRGFGAMGHSPIFDLLSVIFWIGLGLLIYRLWTRSQSQIHTKEGLHKQPTETNAIAIAKERFAKGEITAEELQAILAVLSK